MKAPKSTPRLITFLNRVLSSKFAVVILALGMGLLIASVHHAFHNTSNNQTGGLLDAAIAKCRPLIGW